MKRIHRRSWDAAIDAVQQDIFAMAACANLNDEADRILTAVFRHCEELRARKHLALILSNRTLSRKYGVSLRTVTNWRREGCPFEQGQWRVLDWLALRRYAPAGTRTKFGQQLNERRSKALMNDCRAAVAQVRHIKLRYREHGLEPPEWMRGFRCPRR
jgi:hypothetical protein